MKTGWLPRWGRSSRSNRFPSVTGHLWAGLLGLTACAAEPKPAMNLMELSNPDQLVATATELAAAQETARHETLRAGLGSEAVLLRFNSSSEYVRLRPDQLRLAGVMKVLGTNAAAAATDTLSALAASPVFLAEEARQDLLLRALAVRRPASPAVVKFFGQQSTAEATHLHLAIDALLGNGDPALIALLESRIIAGVYEPEDLGGWMRDGFLRHRQDVALLEACERLLRGDQLSGELKVSLVEALFDYRPEEWYPPDSPVPKPPDRSQASPTARAVLLRIGAWSAGQPNLPAGLKARVAAELKLLE